MMELIDSKYTREKYKELGIEFTDWQKAAILSQKPLPYHERINALLELSKEIEDTILKKQIEERVSYEKKMLEYFVRNIDDKYVYVVKDIIDECEYGYFSIFETALVQARKIVKKNKIKMKIEKHLIIKDTVIPKGVIKIGWNRYLFPDKPETDQMETDFLGLLRGDIILNLDGEIESICSSEMSDEEERMIDGFDNERFDGQFIKVPYVHKAGMLVRYANTDRYAVLATTEKEWNDFLEKVERGKFETKM